MEYKRLYSLAFDLHVPRFNTLILQIRVVAQKGRIYIHLEIDQGPLQLYFHISHTSVYMYVLEIFTNGIIPISISVRTDCPEPNHIMKK